MPANVAITQDTSNPYSESDIAINPGNLQQIIASSNANNGSTMAQYWSHDAGVTWTDSNLPTVSTDNFQSDPAVGWTSDGTGWALCIGVVQTATTSSFKVRSFKSTDAGKTWTYDSDVSGTQTATDKASLWIDRSSGITKDNIYAVWHLNATCYVSVRKGPRGTWGTPLAVSGSETTFSADGGDIKTNAYGDVFAFWPDAGGQTIRVAKSTDGGSTFSALSGSPVKIASTSGSFLISIPAQAIRPAGSFTGCLIYVTGGAYRTASVNNVYAIWHDLSGETNCTKESQQPGTTVTSTCKTRIWFNSSNDGGQTWNTAVMINNQSSKNDQFFPRLAVDDTTGDLMVVYYDTVNDPNRVKTDIWTQYSKDGGTTWSPAVQVTTAETNEATGNEDLGNQYGDYIGITGYSGRYFACWTDRRGGTDEQIYGAALAIPDMEFKIQQDTFSKDEIAATGTSFQSAFYLAVSGFTNEALGFTSTGSLNAVPALKPTVVASLNPLLNSLSASQIATINSNLPSVNGIGLLPILATDDSLKLEQQTFWYPFTVQFSNDNACNVLTSPEVAIVTLTATFTVGPITLTVSANIELGSGEDPRFEDYTPSNPLAYPSWLSFDLRFFKVTPTQSHKWFNVTNPADAAGCVTYIQNVLTNLNTPGTNLNGDTFDGSLSQDEEQSALEFLPANSTTGDLTFNFAVARVRIKSTVSETTPVVRVFFRLFQAASTVSNFIEVGTGQGTYRWGTNGTPGHKIPLLGVQTDQNGNLEYITIPCFATARVNLGTPADMNQQTDPPNAHPINTIANTEVDTYFGCWLDVNQTGGANNFLIKTPPTNPSQWDGPWTGTESINGALTIAPHQCVIAEIRYDDTPIPTNATSATTDKLAQRNIAWIDGPNPGTDPSRLMSHPCEIRASVSNAAADELMITWGTTPNTGTASLYLPAVSSADVLSLANAMYPAHRLSIVDPHTIGFPSNSMTLVPVPAGTGRYAGLLSIQLPSGIHKGEQYNIAVRQFENISAVIPSPPPAPKISVARRAAAASPAAVAVSNLNWRQLLGAFQYTITISTKDQLLYPEERLLAWLKWRLSVTPHFNRWYPVLERYLYQTTGRVNGYGGNAGSINPSQNGIIPGHGPVKPPHHLPKPGQDHARGFTGKVIGITYDRFGDFEGFTLLTEHGTEHWFRGHEERIEDLVMMAWRERIVITVYVQQHTHDWPSSIVLRRL
jgi:hypothetical protein